MAALPKPGAVLDGFVVGERLHEGGMAVIHEVTGRETGFPMVMKLPRLVIRKPSTRVTIGCAVPGRLLGA